MSSKATTANTGSVGATGAAMVAMDPFAVENREGLLKVREPFVNG